jgi:molybdopterin-synthase adenylyltransferase
MAAFRKDSTFLFIPYSKNHVYHMKKTFSVTMSGEINSRLAAHLIRGDQQEDLCFALFNPCHGAHRFTAIIDEIILPEDGERQVHGNVSFNPVYYERVLFLAAQKKKGVAILHSHPSPVSRE